MHRKSITYFDNASTSLKFPILNSVLQESYQFRYNSEFVSSKIVSLFQKLSDYFDISIDNISLVPSSSYAINEIWDRLIKENIINKGEALNIYLFQGEHISNLSSVYNMARDNSEICVHILKWEEKDRTIFEKTAILLLSIRDNLGVSAIYDWEIEYLRVKFPELIIIGDLTQYIQYSKRGEYIFQLFDYFYFSAHKWFGPFGIGVVCSRNFSPNIGINFRTYATSQKYLIDWRSLLIWERLFLYIEEQILKNEWKIKELWDYWNLNFPKTSYLRYIRSPVKSLIFLVEVKKSFSHDFLFWLEQNNIIFRSRLLCNSGILVYNSPSIIRFSLSILNTIDEIKKLFRLFLSYIRWWENVKLKT